LGVGNKIKKSLWDFFLFISFFLEILIESLNIHKTKRVSLPVIIRQILFTGVETFPIITFVALGVGGLIILQGYNILSNFGQGNWIHMILVTVVIRELSSIFTALIVIARSGTAISTELGNMVVNREIDLLLSFKISPLSYLVNSRVTGVVVSMFILTIYFNITAVFGGWFFSSFFSRIDFLSFMNGFSDTLRMADILISTIKSIVFGMIIALISCYQGLQVKYASTEVPQRTIRAVVQAMVWVILFDVVITWVFYYFT
jgi:phospholipid/cholesterol/gamma-HCH transport system permease protein